MKLIINISRLIRRWYHYHNVLYFNLINPANALHYTMMNLQIFLSSVKKPGSTYIYFPIGMINRTCLFMSPSFTYKMVGSFLCPLWFPPLFLDWTSWYTWKKSLLGAVHYFTILLCTELTWQVHRMPDWKVLIRLVSHQKVHLWWWFFSDLVTQLSECAAEESAPLVVVLWHLHTSEYAWPCYSQGSLNGYNIFLMLHRSTNVEVIFQISWK